MKSCVKSTVPVIPLFSLSSGNFCHLLSRDQALSEILVRPEVRSLLAYTQFTIVGDK